MGLIGPMGSPLGSPKMDTAYLGTTSLPSAKSGRLPPEGSKIVRLRHLAPGPGV
jgi:hypothetical protein